ncbi:MAG: hypothetical protein ACI9VR_004465 [Cognaticolwellia sp.]|jgi:hypothetical protein
MGLGTTLIAFGLCVGGAQAGELGPGDVSAPKADASQGAHGVRYSSGSYAEAIALDLPPGVAGHTPPVSLVMTSAAPDGPVGKGWAIGGVSRITRHGSKWGGASAAGANPGETFMLDGQVLEQVSAGGVSWYETERWNGGKVEYNGLSNSWTVTQDGVVSTYGLAVSQVPGFAAFARTQTAYWTLTEVTDPHGNSYQYGYQHPNISDANLLSQYGLHGVGETGEVLLSEVSWGANKISLTYSLRPSFQVGIGFREGRRVISERRLDYMEVSVGGGAICSLRRGLLRRGLGRDPSCAAAVSGSSKRHRPRR